MKNIFQFINYEKTSLMGGFLIYYVGLADQKSNPIAKYHIGLPLKKPFISQAVSSRRK